MLESWNTSATRSSRSPGMLSCPSVASDIPAVRIYSTVNSLDGQLHAALEEVADDIETALGDEPVEVRSGKRGYRSWPPSLRRTIRVSPIFSVN